MLSIVFLIGHISASKTATELRRAAMNASRRGVCRGEPGPDAASLQASQSSFLYYKLFGRAPYQLRDTSARRFRVAAKLNYKGVSIVEAVKIIRSYTIRREI